MTIHVLICKTLNRTLEELEEMFEKRLSARKFSKYQCSGIETILRDIKDGEVTVHEAEQASTAV